MRYPTALLWGASFGVVGTVLLVSTEADKQPIDAKSTSTIATPKDSPTPIRNTPYRISSYDGYQDKNDYDDFDKNESLRNTDSDGDGLNNYEEQYIYKTNPMEEDTDNDDLSDFDEINSYGTNPKSWDTDNDGLSDGSEVDFYDTDPNDADTDGDGYSDGEEVKSKTDPNDELDYPQTVTTSKPTTPTHLPQPPID